jgi:transposase
MPLTQDKRCKLERLIISKMKGDTTITDEDIAADIRCSTRTVRTARKNIVEHCTIDGSRKAMGRPRKVTDNMWLAVKHDLEHGDPTQSQQQMADLLYTQFASTVSRVTLGRELDRRGWTKKITETVAKERNQTLRNDYIERRSHFKPEQMIYIDESGWHPRDVKRNRGYAPKGVTPVQFKRFNRGNRVQMLPAYTIDGVIYSEVYEENTDLQVFEGFLERLLPSCGRYPAPKSVIFMDNASFHNVSPRIKELYAQAGVVIQYTPPNSPDLSPIEYFFGSLKNRIRERCRADADLIRGDYKSYLRLQIRIVGGEKRIARGHFRKAQICIED